MAPGVLVTFCSLIWVLVQCVYSVVKKVPLYCILVISASVYMSIKMNLKN